ncbi:protein GrpE [Dioscorea cayenensis subsp. rotundata]|uniref:GrpE protein homolog n=1 Tax=Dioscorea cayennensis subsp. rotundata TaxID=55577 RepID=A0AB40CBZ6_DIOCR|nr:protein GrpE [Dioscorea cayenensis subsp. rotundata]
MAASALFSAASPSCAFSQARRCFPSPPPSFSLRLSSRCSLSSRFPVFGLKSSRKGGFLCFATVSTEQDVYDSADKEDAETDIPAEEGADDDVDTDTEEDMDSAVLSSLQLYKEALARDDQSKIAEIEAFLLSIEDEKNSLATKVDSLSQELATERDRILRISADFDNFRKRTEKERLSLMSNVQGDVIESLLPVLDNFERAKDQIKAETEGEEKINNSYQSIYKQFMEILTSLGVEAVQTVGHPFDPLLHEAIMREDSMEFEEGIILQEFRKGFKLGERLIRPSMVKVSAGPGPAKAEDQGDSGENEGEASQESTPEDGQEGGDSV